jgi:hypothetical protein
MIKIMSKRVVVAEEFFDIISVASKAPGNRASCRAREFRLAGAMLVHLKVP